MPARPPFRRSSLLVGLAVAATGLVAIPVTATANPAGTGLVISEVYGAGGNGTGSSFRSDFIELYNPTNAAIDVQGWSVQYRSTSGSSVGSNITPLTGSVPAGSTYLVAEAAGADTTAPALPEADATGTIAMAGGSGQVLLVTSSTASAVGTGNLAGNTGLIDMVGYGTAGSFETAPTGVVLANTTSASRNAAGTDTDNNAADFTAGSPSPQGSGSTTPPVDPPDPTVTEQTIAQIQGTGATSPLAGQNVKTQGVVTASYPTGGLNGFYLQTPGADTANASDAVFVYGGPTGFTTYPAVGDSVEVTGEVAEYFGATQIEATQAGVVPVAALGTVTPKTQVPGTDCALPGTDCLAGAALDDAREVAEGELFQPTAPWTATDVYDGGPYYSNGSNSSSFRGEIGVAANSDKPLVAPTEVIDAQATALIAERKKYNDAHRIILDDASSTTFSTTQNDDQPFPWFTADHTVRVGAGLTFLKPVIFTFGFNAWRILPQAQVVGAPTGVIKVEQTRPAAPQAVGGDVKLATFNVLNFFPTTGAEFVASGLGTCTYYRDRDGNPISNNRCDPDGPRGAADQANLTRQRDKIVAAINTADADIVSLEELENSVKFNKPRDFAINELVSALNAAAGAGTWAAVPSATTLPPTSEQDVIRNGFIYQPAQVALVGESVVLSDQSSAGEAFEDAREPVAQAFKKVGTADADAFAVVVNHFKSKGSGTPDPDGQGNATDRRVIQANALVGFADAFKTQRAISRVFLAGDFNAYSEEDPIQALEAAGYTNLESTSKPDEETYNFDGMIGSLDHVLANGAALKDVNAVDVWDINGYESVYYEYARFNSNVTNLYAPNPFRSSDHSPEIVGIRTASVPVTPPGTPATTVAAAITPQRVVVDRTRAVAHVTVTTGDKKSGNGTVEVREGSTLLASAPVTNGVVNIKLPAFTTVGEHTLTVRYVEGSSTVAESTVVVDVLKAASDARATAATKGGAPVVGIHVKAQGLKAKGKVKLVVKGTSAGKGKTVLKRTVRLKGGKATVRLAGLRAGRYTVVVRYLGNDDTSGSKETLRLRVRR
jgi:predicted extracellular nuclease